MTDRRVSARGSLGDSVTVSLANSLASPVRDSLNSRRPHRDPAAGGGAAPRVQRAAHAVAPVAVPHNSTAVCSAWKRLKFYTHSITLLVLYEDVTGDTLFTLECTRHTDGSYYQSSDEIIIGLVWLVELRSRGINLCRVTLVELFRTCTFVGPGTRPLSALSASVSMRRLQILSCSLPPPLSCYHTAGASSNSTTSEDGRYSIGFGLYSSSRKYSDACKIATPCARR